MRRKNVVHYAPAQRKLSVAQLAGKAHFHFCDNRDCRIVYEDACERPESNGRCHACRGLRRPVTVSSRDPHECCLDNCQMVSDLEHILRYQLAGPGPWFQCSTCKRCHGWPCTT